MKQTLLMALLSVAIAGGAIVGYRIWWNTFYFSVERTDVNPAPDPLDDLNLVDDLLEDKNPGFDALRVDSRDYEDWQINQSAAVIRLDCPDIRPDRESEMTRLYATWADAIREAESRRLNLLPSANMLDGVAKQFDDGLYAALDLACFQGRAGFPGSAVHLMQSIYDELPDDSSAVPWLAAALKLAGVSVLLENEQQPAEVDGWISRFEADAARSKPIAFYTWSDDLTRVWKFHRFLQQPFVQSELDIPNDIARAIESNQDNRQTYANLIAFFSRLTNPPICLDLSQLGEEGSNLADLARAHGVPQARVSVFPPSTSRETELFNRLFAAVSAGRSNLMLELIRRIRSGQIDLTPRPGHGWYEHQVYALETLLLPQRGAENEKLLMTARYKRRLIQAFEAMITKRRETHARQLAVGEATSVMPPKKIAPRLRVEPCATYYLRTARSYAFLESFLQSSIGAEGLSQLHGLRQDGQRELDLQTELAQVKELFYGFHLIACEDIGMAHEIQTEESVDIASATAAAETWLSDLNHGDLAVDTRVSIPVFNDPTAGATRLWATIGIRLAKLNARYVRPPKMRENAQAEWQDVESWRLGESDYVIAVDEFVEFDLPGSQALNREELRAVCDRHQTKSAILKALSSN